MWRAQIATTFVIDPFFTAIIVAGLIASICWKVRRAPAVIGLAVLAAYVGFQAVLQRRAVAAGEVYIAAHGLESAQAPAIPQPLSRFNWMVVVEQPQGYHLAYVSLLRKEIAPQPAGGCFLVPAAERVIPAGQRSAMAARASLRCRRRR
jgi:inner membrane protein